MQLRLSVLALFAAVVFVGCRNDNGRQNDGGGGGQDLRAPRDLTSEETPDLRRVRDFATPDEDLAVDPNADLAVDPNADLAADPNADLAVDPNADLGVDPNADLTPPVVPPDLLGSTDLAALECASTASAQVRHGAFASRAFGATNLGATLALPRGFTIEGIVTWPSAYENSIGTYAGGVIEFINRGTGERYFGTVDGEDSDPDMYFIYSVVVPPGRYDINTTMFMVYDNADGGALVTSYGSLGVDVCGDNDTVNIEHAALPPLVRRSVRVDGLAAAYDADTDPNFWGSLTVESTDGLLAISMYAHDYDTTGGDFSLTWAQLPLPEQEVRPSLYVYNQPYAPAYATTGWDHVYRLPNAAVVPGDLFEDAFAVNPSVVAANVVRLSGSVTDATARLGREFVGFDSGTQNHLYYVSHSVTCAAAGDSPAATQPYGAGYLSTTSLAYDTPVQKDVACGVYGQFKVRVPLADNAGAPPPAPGAATNTNYAMGVFTDTVAITPTANTTRNYSIPDFAATGESTQTLTIQDASGAPVAGALVVVESEGWLDNANGFNATTGALTDASGQVTLRVLRGTYKISVDFDF